MSQSIPIIKLEVEYMRQAMHVALSEYTIQMDKMVKDAVDEFCTEENLRRIIETESQRVLDSAVREAVKSWWMVSEEGQRLINKVIAAKLKEESKYYE